MCCPGADRFGGESNAFATRQADAAARDITRARLAVLIDDLRSPYAEHVYIGHDFTKGDLLRKLQAIKDTA